uniref:Uncharacterized protein n=1 Tax=Ascaris lumbricoides TaxID=6252 RepID=A0A0M3I4K5_ASCLU
MCPALRSSTTSRETPHYAVLLSAIRNLESGSLEVSALKVRGERFRIGRTGIRSRSAVRHLASTLTLGEKARTTESPTRIAAVRYLSVECHGEEERKKRGTQKKIGFRIGRTGIRSRSAVRHLASTLTLGEKARTAESPTCIAAVRYLSVECHERRKGRREEHRRRSVVSLPQAAISNQA